MLRKWVAGLVAAIAVISVGGVGFAAFTSMATLQFNGAGGTLNLEWTGPSAPAATVTLALPSDSATCNIALTPLSLKLTFKNMAPNDTCEMLAGDGVYLHNPGTLNGVVTLSLASIKIPASCFWGYYTNLLGTSSIAAGASIPTGGVYLLWEIYPFLNQDNHCQGATIQFWLNWTATAGT